MTTNNSRLPRFLTKDIAEDAIQKIMGNLFSCFPEIDDFNYHVIIVVPKMVYLDDGSRPQDGRLSPYRIDPHVLCEYSKKTTEWKHNLDSIAGCKAVQLWDGFADGELRIRPHLLLPNDTRWVGGVKREGIVVACSGFEEYFDRMVSSMIADACIALAAHSFKNSPEVAGGKDWIGMGVVPIAG